MTVFKDNFSIYITRGIHLYQNARFSRLLIGYFQVATFKIANRLILPIRWEIELADNKTCFVIYTGKLSLDFSNREKIKSITRRQNIFNENCFLFIVIVI